MFSFCWNCFAEELIQLYGFFYQLTFVLLLNLIAFYWGVNTLIDMNSVKKKKLCRWFHNAWMFVLRWGESGRGVARWENREEAEGKRAEDRHTARSQTETCNAKKEKLHLYRSSARISLLGELFPEESERSCDLRRKRASVDAAGGFGANMDHWSRGVFG